MGTGGQCRFLTSPPALAKHGIDVYYEGGARGTGVARYGSLRAQLDTASAKGVSAEDISKAKSLLELDRIKVRQHAARGTLQGADFEGVTAMRNDDATMSILKQADALLNSPPVPQIAEPGKAPGGYVVCPFRAGRSGSR